MTKRGAPPAPICYIYVVFLPILRIHAVTDRPMRCLKARLKVLYSVAAFVSQLLGSERAHVSDSLVIETNEMMDTQVVDIGIVSGVLAREILAQVEAVRAKGLGKLGQGQVVLQVEPRVDTVLL